MACIIGFDYGERRIGVAISVLELGIANPLKTIESSESKFLWREIDQIIKEWAPITLVVGCVEHATQNNNLIKKKINVFCKNLKSRYHLPVEIIDESYSSTTANEILKDMRRKGQRKKINKPDIDKASAAIILNTWLSSRSNSKIHSHD